jgi:hypothetical protein
MADPVQLQDRFSEGVKRDFPRNQMPARSLWWAEDLIPNLGAPLRGRGGYSYASADITSTVATSSYIIAGIYAGYEDSNRHVVVDEDGRFIEVVSDVSTTDIAAGVTTLQNPVMHRDIVVVPASGGATNPKSIKHTGGGYVVADLAGTPPQAKFASVHKDRTLLACTTAEPQRLWFSDAGDPEGWDTTNTYWDFNDPISGLEAVRSSILVFSQGNVSRLRGSTPPPGSDFVADDPFIRGIGCDDARSIASTGDVVVFASRGGIHITDGVTVADLTKRCDMLSYWQEQMAAYAASTWTIAGGIIRGNYFVNVMDGATPKFSALIEVNRYRWWPMTNIDARGLWQGASQDELYFGRRGAARVGKLSSIFMPASGTKNDAEGTAVTPLGESPFYLGRPGLKRWRNILPSHDITDYASDNPTLTYSYVTTPEETSYTALATVPAETTALSRPVLFIGKAAYGIGLKWSQTNAADHRFYGVEAEVEPMDPGRV